MAHRRRWRADRGTAGSRGSLSAGPVAEPAGIPQGGATARRQSCRLVALGTDRKRAGRRGRPARKGVRRRDYDAREIPRRRHHQFTEPDHPHQDHGERAGAWRLQHRARVDGSADVRQHQLADRVALASGWDDNWRFIVEQGKNAAAGSSTFIQMSAATPAVPASLLPAPSTPWRSKDSDGVYLLRRAPTLHSEFRDFAPCSSARKRGPQSRGDRAIAKLAPKTDSR